MTLVDIGRLRELALRLYKNQIAAIDLVAMMMREAENIQNLKKMIKMAEALMRTAGALGD